MSRRETFTLIDTNGRHPSRPADASWWLAAACDVPAVRNNVPADDYSRNICGYLYPSSAYPDCPDAPPRRQDGPQEHYDVRLGLWRGVPRLADTGSVPSSPLYPKFVCGIGRCFPHGRRSSRRSRRCSGLHSPDSPAAAGVVKFVFANLAMLYNVRGGGIDGSIPKPVSRTCLRSNCICI